MKLGISFVVALSLSSSACSHEEAAAPVAAAPAAPQRPLIAFDYKALDGRPISSERFAGRFTVIAFLTTYDVASQAQARFLTSFLHRHAPRANVAALFLESPDNAPLVTAFAETLKLEYPVGIADADTIAGRGPFEGSNKVPSVVVLDRTSHAVYSRTGIIDDKALDKVLKEAEEASR